MLPPNLMGILLAPWGQRFLSPAHPFPSKQSPAPQLFPPIHARNSGAASESALKVKPEDGGGWAKVGSGFLVLPAGRG